METIKLGMSVKNEWDISGVVVDVFDSWEDLKSKNNFITFDPDNESKEMDAIEKLINGDPRDEWLKQQRNPITYECLNQRWFSVYTFNGGSIWSCESRLSIL